jgi:hypothetical protein
MYFKEVQKQEQTKLKLRREIIKIRFKNKQTLFETKNHTRSTKKKRKRLVLKT